MLCGGQCIMSVSGIRLLEPTCLYNWLNQGGIYPKLSDPNYLLLIGEKPFLPPPGMAGSQPNSVHAQWPVSLPFCCCWFLFF